MDDSGNWYTCRSDSRYFIVNRYAQSHGHKPSATDQYTRPCHAYARS